LRNISGKQGRKGALVRHKGSGGGKSVKGGGVKQGR